MRVRKAVFPVAGLGTRFLPITKSTPKELLPLIDTPIIKFATDEAIAAGIDTLIFVTGRMKRSIGDFYDANLELEYHLGAARKDAELEQIRSIVPTGINCLFVRQPAPVGLGDAVLRAAPAVGDEPFAVLLADDLMTGPILPTTQLVESHGRHGGSVISALEVDRSEVSKYGILHRGAEDAEGLISVPGIVEKPTAAAAPSTLASMGRYVFDPAIFSALRSIGPGANGEIQLADAINTLARRGQVHARRLVSKRYDCGSKFGYLEAIIDHALSQPEYRDRFSALIRQRLANLDG